MGENAYRKNTETLIAIGFVVIFLVGILTGHITSRPKPKGDVKRIIIKRDCGCADTVSALRYRLNASINRCPDNFNEWVVRATADGLIVNTEAYNGR